MEWPTRFLWLMPERKACELLTAQVVRLARQLGGPSFAPHLTFSPPLYEDEDILMARCRTLAGELAPVPLTFDGVEVGSSYHQSVYLRLAESPALLAARARALAILGQAEAGFMPHISLGYGGEPEARQRAAAMVPAAVLAEARADRVRLVWASGPEPDRWCDVAEFVLTGDASGPGPSGA